MSPERALPVTGTRHVIVLSEQEMPGAWEVRCTACHTEVPHERCTAACHRVTWTPWGEDAAHEIGELHIFYMTHRGAPRFHHEAARGGVGGSGRRIR